MNMPVTKAKSLEFTEEYVTDCLERNVPIFEWDGRKGLVRDWEITTSAGRWELVVVTDGPYHGRICARPTGAQTLRVFRESKVRDYAKLGIDDVFSRIYLRRVRFVQYSMSDKTVVWVWKHFLMPSEHLSIIDQSTDQMKTARELGYEVETSARKFENWIRIIYVLRRDDKGFDYALRVGVHLSKDEAWAVMSAESPVRAMEELGYDTEGHPDHLIKKAASLCYYYHKARA